MKYISFDLDDTLCDQDHFDTIFWNETIPKLFAKKHNLGFKKAKNKVDESFKNKDMNEPDWWRPSFWFNHFKFEENHIDILNHLAKDIKIFDDVKPCLDILKKEGFKLIVLTHSVHEFVDLKMKAESISVYFDVVFSTIDDFHMVKKDPKVYQLLLEKLNISSDDIIHIGDNKVYDYDSPKKFGIKSFLLDRSKKLSGDDIVHDLNEFVEEVNLLLPELEAISNLPREDTFVEVFK